MTSSNKVTTIIEHLHPKQVEERVIRQDGPVIRQQVVEREIIPEEKIEVHKHVHPVEKVEIHEIHKRPELEVIRENVHEMHVKEIHEHVYPVTNIEVEKEVVHPENVSIVNRVLDQGEVERKVIDKEMNSGNHEHTHKKGNKKRVVNPTS